MPDPAGRQSEARPWDIPAEGLVTRYGFQWGPLIVTRMAHITRRGYVLSIETPHESMQVYVTEKGRRIRPMTVRAK
jgi:hypothetical protein